MISPLAGQCWGCCLHQGPKIHFSLRRFGEITARCYQQLQRAYGLWLKKQYSYQWSEVFELYFPHTHLTIISPSCLASHGIHIFSLEVEKRYSIPVTSCRAEKRMGGRSRALKTVDSGIPIVHKMGVAYAALMAVEMGKQYQLFFFFSPPTVEGKKPKTFSWA